jgi:predicted  nucleic acid-binding Zn-ribbon protein
MEIKIEHRLTELEERSKANSHRLDDVEKRQDTLEKLTSAVEVLAVRENNLESDMKEVKADVKRIADKPAKRWESLVEKIILAIVAGIVGFALSQIGF